MMIPGGGDSAWDEKRGRIMDCKFILICATLALIVLLLIVILFMQARLLRRLKKTEQEPVGHASSPEPQSTAPAAGVVHCRACGERMDTAQRLCPKCGAPRP